MAVSESTEGQRAPGDSPGKGASALKKAMETLKLRCAGLWRKNLPGGGGFREKARGWASGEVLRTGGGVCSLVARTRPSVHLRHCKAVCSGHVV